MALSWPQRAALALLLVAAAYGLHHGRRAFIRGFFVDGPPVPPGSVIAGEGLGPAPRVRVVLLDGLGLETALALPALSSLCARGEELRIDVGFPTVSLPVQHVLWTGRSQQASGILYRIPRIDPPPAEALPGRVPGSWAVAESHPAIVHSFGFTTAEPPLGEKDAIPEGWRERFAEAALAAVTSPSPLVFVHVLRIDEAGHASGAASPAYAAAAAEADAILGRLVAAIGRADDVRWWVLADHGHRPAGGHGGAEASIRIVRGCLAGAGVAPSSSTPKALRMVDLARAVGDSVGRPPAAGAEGAPWASIVAARPLETTVPTPTILRWFVGLVVGLGLLLASLRGLDRRELWIAAWPLLGELGITWFHGVPTLSNPVVYPPLGQAMAIAAAPAWLMIVIGVVILRRRGRGLGAIAGVVLGPPAALLALASVLAGLGDRGPWLMPIWSAQVSVAALFLPIAALLLGIVVLLPTSPVRRDPSGPAAGNAPRG